MQLLTTYIHHLRFDWAAINTTMVLVALKQARARQAVGS